MARLRGCIWLVAGLLIATLAGVMAYLYLGQAAEQTAEAVDETPRVDVVVAARQITVRSQITGEDLQLIGLPVDTVPEGAIPSIADAVGRVTLVDLYPGEPLLAQRLIEPNYVSGDARHALVLKPEEVLMAYPAEELMTSLTVLKPGDRVDILISLDIPMDAELGAGAATAGGDTATAEEEDEEQATFILLQNVGIAALPGSEPAETDEAGAAVGGLTGQPQQQAVTQPPQAVLFTLAPQDALVLKFVLDAGAIQDLVLRAPGTTTPFETEPVNMDYLINRFSLPTEVVR